MRLTLPQFKNTNSKLLFFSAFFIIALVTYAIFRDHSQTITLASLKELLKSSSVEKVVEGEKYTYIVTPKVKYKIPTSQVTPELFKNQKIENETSSYIFTFIIALFLFLAIASILLRAIQKKVLHPSLKEYESQEESLQSSEMSQHIQAVKSDVSFKDIGGIGEVKIELEEIIDFLKHPKKYKSFGARLPRGVLLVGPPGVGKTMIAKAVAAEAEVPFFYQSGASFVQIYVGMGAKRVHELFLAAQKNQPSIIFIDEIDAIGKKRDGQKNDEREATLNQLLTEMDGFENSSNIIVIAATNKIDVLDEALLRAGRFDRRIFVELPTPSERAAIVKKYLEKIPNDVNADDVAKITLGFNGASLAALINEAALFALRAGDFSVHLSHIDAVKDKVQFGKKMIPILSDKQRNTRALYQAAKALYAAWHDINFDRILLTTDSFKPPLNEPMLERELRLHIKLHLVGMAACRISFDEHDSFAKKDVDVVKNLIHLMVDEYAMGEKFYSDTYEKEQLIEQLMQDVTHFVEKKMDIIKEIMQILLEEESISKILTQEIINEVIKK